MKLPQDRGYQSSKQLPTNNMSERTIETEQNALVVTNTGRQVEKVAQCTGHYQERERGRDKERGAERKGEEKEREKEREREGERSGKREEGRKRERERRGRDEGGGGREGVSK